MKIYMIMAVRDGVSEKAIDYLDDLEIEGHWVHFPPRDAPQDDPIGDEICRVHLMNIRDADEVHVLWDVNSKGSHFDLGMAYALGKKIVPVCCDPPDAPGKSYWKAVINPTPAQRASES